jgi:hypothetical protein
LAKEATNSTLTFSFSLVALLPPSALISQQRRRQASTPGHVLVSKPSFPASTTPFPLGKQPFLLLRLPPCSPAAALSPLVPPRSPRLLRATEGSFPFLPPASRLFPRRRRQSSVPPRRSSLQLSTSLWSTFSPSLPSQPLPPLPLLLYRQRLPTLPSFPFPLHSSLLLTYFTLSLFSFSSSPRLQYPSPPRCSHRCRRRRPLRKFDRLTCISHLPLISRWRDPLLRRDPPRRTQEMRRREEEQDAGGGWRDRSGGVQG